MLEQEQGILLLALGHPYYGRMAYNLAMSIKAVDSSVDITLVYTEGSIAHINQRNMWVFNNKMQIPEDSQPFGAKLSLDKLTPYQRTLYIDVDTLWINKQSPERLFEQLKGVAFTGITEGFHDFSAPEKSEPNKLYPTWAEVEEIKSAFGLTNPILYQWRSEFIYFEKAADAEDTPNAEEVFARARLAYEAAQELKTVKKFANHIPDELALNISVNQCGIWPHKYKWKPTYWDRLNGGVMPNIDDLQSNYYVISCGSNANGGALKRVYDRICAASAYKLKLQHVFPLISKKEMLINRQLM